ncbi:MAG TPA: hypothetical protein VKC51_10890 [Lacunisphaera sp.]|nr:hypothetical protein [Lacunisphaera sp.]
MKTLRFSFLFLLGAVTVWAQAPAKAAPVAPAPALTPAMKPVDWKADPVMTEYAKQAGSRALADWMADFLSKKFSAKSFALLPLGSDLDDGYFTLQARNEFAGRASGTEFSLFTRDDDEWKSLLKEIRIGDQEGDTMATATIQKFGRIQGVQGIIRGRISGVYTGMANTGSVGGVHMADDAKVLQVRVILQAFEVETGRLLWGGEKIAAVSLPDESLVVPGTKRQWILYGAAAIGAILVLFIILRMLKSANGPR